MVEKAYVASFWRPKHVHVFLQYGEHARFSPENTLSLCYDKVC